MKTLILSIMLMITLPLLATEKNYENTEEYKNMIKMKNTQGLNNYQPSFNISKGLREKNNLGINASIGSSAVLGFTIDYFITENISLEVSFLAGYIPGVIGIKTYFTPKDNWSMYLGLHVTIGLYIPIGIEYMNEDGFKISFELGPAIIPKLNISWEEDQEDDRGTSSQLIPWGGIKIGYYF